MSETITKTFSVVHKSSNHKTSLLIPLHDEKTMYSKSSRDGLGAAIYATGEELHNNQNIGGPVSLHLGITQHQTWHNFSSI